MHIKKNGKKAILIQGCDNIELSYFLSHIKKPLKSQINGFMFISGYINDRFVVLSNTNVGEYNSALATTIAINNFKIRMIINQGTIGAYKKNIHIGDIIIGEKIFNKDTFRLSIDKSGVETFIKFDKIVSDEYEISHRILKYLSGNSELVEKAMSVDYAHGKVHRGIIASGNTWHDDVDTIMKLENDFDVYGEEMESYAVTYVANAYNIPSIIIRVVSNNAVTGEAFDQDSAYLGSEFVCDFIKGV